MPNKYMEKYKKLVDLAWLATEGYNRGENKDKYYKEAMMYATVANAMTSMFSINISEDTAEEKPKETKPATKEDLKPKPVMHTVGSEDSPETGSVPEAKKEESKAEVKETQPEDTAKMAQDIATIQNIIQTMIDTTKHPNNYSIPMDMVMYWMSQAVGTKIEDINELNNHMDKLPALLDYFTKLDFIFNKINADIPNTTQALAFATQGRYTTIDKMSPDNIDVVIDAFKQAIQNQQQAAAQ